MVTWVLQKVQSVIIYDIEIFCECVVIPQRGYNFIHDIALKVLEHSKNVNEYPS